MLNENDTYIGNELELFQNAENWKKYYGSFLKPYLKGRVLEVGAGIGGTTQSLCDGSQKEWLCLEPDKELALEIEKKINEKKLPPCCKLIKGTLADISASEYFDAIIYIDVIEHIEKDGDELKLAQSHLAEGGALMILVPAHQWLFSPFDKAIGHFRRYNKKMLLAAAPQSLQLKKIVYLDSVGLFASLANKFFLKQEAPTHKQILFWDKVIVRISRFMDFIFAYTRGKSLLGIWLKK